jgi:hypothetical protein
MMVIKSKLNNQNYHNLISEKLERRLRGTNKKGLRGITDYSVLIDEGFRGIREGIKIKIIYFNWVILKWELNGIDLFCFVHLTQPFDMSSWLILCGD